LGGSNKTFPEPTSGTLYLESPIAGFHFSLRSNVKEKKGKITFSLQEVRANELFNIEKLMGGKSANDGEQ